MRKYQYHDVNFRGRIERVSYQTTNREGEIRSKYANVYLPYGYEADDTEKKYNVLYLMHGGGGNPDAWLDCSTIKNMLDYTISVGEVKPLIVVFPSYYKEAISRIGGPDGDLERENVKFFQKELAEDLIPAVEEKYNTYAEGITPEALKDSRLHRGFGGFSMGGAATWFAFQENMDYISHFLPLSGDCWTIEVKGGATKTAETARALHDFAIKSGYNTEQYFIYAATGTKDIAYEPLTRQIEEMKKYPDTFVYSEDYAKGNFHYLLAEGEIHSYEAVYQYLYCYLPYLFLN